MFTAYQFQIKLLGSPTPVWRRFIIPAETNFKRLHDAIQLVMWWEDSHLAKFEDDLRNPTFRFVLNPEEVYEHKDRLAYLKAQSKLSEFETNLLERFKQVTVRDMKNVKLPSIIESHQTLYYTYDYGDDWQHELILEKVIADYPHPHPMVTEWEGETPFEDIGGMAGNIHLQEILNDPNHPQHEEMIELGKEVEPYEVDRINFLLKEYVTVKRVK
ncbi:plasmid pRiA4b ORF-3 family protein [Exiguobacterium sp. SH0S1]|uniref:plasmid pRiA4b ORF-3 family protein n=1 Tax=Exiguobacterium TaxID=33986 RepID=UPI0008779F9D|nr:MULTISPECIES: plasmid pRiA4b ORF-3 family protein [Exiguobacterium]TCI75843.1 plasmid pRiA4b ORF-3 family protein [Exiguobacterium sp. SH0S1]